MQTTSLEDSDCVIPPESFAPLFVSRLFFFGVCYQQSNSSTTIVNHLFSHTPLVRNVTAIYVSLAYNSRIAIFPTLFRCFSLPLYACIVCCLHVRISPFLVRNM